MKVIQVLHETAMEYVDFADRAKHRGDTTTYQALLEKAYLLEKEAALKMLYQGHTTSWRFLLLKSAGWLALQVGKVKEAAYLANLGLKNQPPANMQAYFQELLKALQKPTAQRKSSKITLTNTTEELSVHIKGILTHANAEQQEIYLQNPENQETYLIHVPAELINDIVKSFWSALVIVEGKTNPLGMITLEKIQVTSL